jgi:hypothetical protein
MVDLDRSLHAIRPSLIASAQMEIMGAIQLASIVQRTKTHPQPHPDVFNKNNSQNIDDNPTLSNRV